MCIEMIQKRNESSHIYLQEVAEGIAEAISRFYDLMDLIKNRIIDKVLKNQNQTVQ